jgi:Leucine-rich repeat (LRR) protein
MVHNFDLFLFVSDLENLVELDLSLNFLSSVPVGALGQLRNLKFLNLGSNRIQVSATSRIREVNHVFHEQLSKPHQLSR